MIKKLLLGGACIESITANIGLAFLRVFAGLTMALAHGLGKLPPAEGFIEGTRAMGFPLPGFFAWAAALSEFGGGLLLALGLMTRPASFFIGTPVGYRSPSEILSALPSNSWYLVPNRSIKSPTSVQPLSHPVPDGFRLFLFTSGSTAQESHRSMQGLPFTGSEQFILKPVILFSDKLAEIGSQQLYLGAFHQGREEETFGFYASDEMV